MTDVCYLVDAPARPHAAVVLEQATQLAAAGLDVTVATTDDAPQWGGADLPVVRVDDFGGRSLPRADLYVGASLAAGQAAHDTGMGIGAHLVLAPDPEHWRIDFVYRLKTVKLTVDPALVDHVSERSGQPCRVLPHGDGLADAVRALIASEREAWDVRDERLVPGECEAVTEAIHMQHYRLVAPHVAGRRVIDAGCGVGYGSRMLADAGAASVLSLDYSEVALAYARANFDHPAITWRQTDLNVQDFAPSSADVVTCFEVFEHLEEPGPLMARLAGALADDGELILSTPNGGVCTNPDDPANVHHVREYDVEELWAILSAHFGDVTMRGQRVSGESLVIAEPAPAVDLCFVASCRAPRRRPAVERFTVVAAPDWSRRDLWLPAVAAWTGAFGPADPATLELLTADLGEAEAALVAGIADLGLDPEAIADIEVAQSSALLRDAADRLADAGGFLALGRDDARLRRLADSFGVPALDGADAAVLAARLPARV